MLSNLNSKEKLKSRLEEYLQQKGIDTRKLFNCLNPEHEDKKPSMSYDKNRNKVHCFSCGVDYDIIDLIQAEHEISKGEAFKKGYEMFRIEPTREQARNQLKSERKKDISNKSKHVTKPNIKLIKNFTGYYKECNKNLSQTSYLKDRGISYETANYYNIGYDSNFKMAGVTWKAIIIPTSTSSFIARNTDKTATATNRYRKVGNSHLFNMKVCKGENSIFIVEGEIDALSIIEAGYKAVALGSAANAKKFVEYVESKKPQNTFILALDNDEAGQKAEQEIADKLKELDIKYIKSNVTGDYKDANEILQKDKETFALLLEEALGDSMNPEQAEKKKELKDYQKNYASNCIEDFVQSIADKVNTPPIPTGFMSLDEALEGGLFEGLYFIGAVSSLGKTTFTLQIADQIAQQGYDVIIFSLEMARNELIAKSLSRLTLINCQNNINNAKTTRGITVYSRYSNYSEVEKNLINISITKYREYANHIIMHEGQGDTSTAQIREVIEKHIHITGNKPVIIIDYLQIIAPYNDRATDKQNIDKAVTELKRISRDYKISLLAISSLNRDNYNNKVSMLAFKESGAIEYSSDVLIGLQFKGMGEKDFDIEQAKQKSNDPKRPREIELRILKNRNGKTGDIIDYEYYALFNYFKEVQGAYK